MSDQLLELLKERREELAGINPLWGNRSRIQAWHVATSVVIAEYFPNQNKAFSQQLIDLRLPTKSDNLAVNDQKVLAAHRRLLAFMDQLIAMQNIGTSSNTDTTESDAIFAETYQLIKLHFFHSTSKTSLQLICAKHNWHTTAENSRVALSCWAPL